jgi:hypothetical protein
MNNFKNVVLQREHKELLNETVDLKKGTLGGHSIEIETRDPVSYDSFLYQGRTAESDRDHDFKIFEELFKKSTE